MTPQMGTGAASRPAKSVSPNRSELARTSAKHAARGLPERAQLVVPLQALDVEEEGAAGVGVIGGKHRAAREAVDEVGVDRAEEGGALGEAGAEVRAMPHEPLDFRAGEIGVDAQAGFRGNQRTSAPARTCSAQRASLRRHCQTMAGASGRPVPRFEDDHRLALIADTHGTQGRGGGGLASQQFGDGGEGVLPNLLGVVFDPARLRIDLPVIARDAVDDAMLRIEEQGLGGRGALIESEEQRHGLRAP
jgi:hypothetical protein